MVAAHDGPQARHGKDWSHSPIHFWGKLSAATHTLATEEGLGRRASGIELGGRCGWGLDGRG